MSFIDLDAVARELVMVVENNEKMQTRAFNLVKQVPDRQCEARVKGALFPIIDMAAHLYVTEHKTSRLTAAKMAEAREHFPENIRDMAVNILYTSVMDDVDCALGRGNYAAKHVVGPWKPKRGDKVDELQPNACPALGIQTGGTVVEVPGERGFSTYIVDWPHQGRCVHKDGELTWHKEVG